MPAGSSYTDFGQSTVTQRNLANLHQQSFDSITSRPNFNSAICVFNLWAEICHSYYKEGPGRRNTAKERVASSSRCANSITGSEIKNRETVPSLIVKSREKHTFRRHEESPFEKSLGIEAVIKF